MNPASSPKRFRFWHALCLLLGLAHCFYLPSLPDVYVNQPPLIHWPETDPYTVVIRQQGRLVLSLRASDPDGDELTCEWPTLENFVYDASEVYSPGLGEIIACSVEIQNPEPLVGQTVTALVTDGDRDNVVPVRFRVEAAP